MKYGPEIPHAHVLDPNEAFLFLILGFENFKVLKFLDKKRLFHESFNEKKCWAPTESWKKISWPLKPSLGVK